MAEAARQHAPSKPDQIIEAARAVFMEQGYGAASMDAIARAANVSKATLYAHFAGKEDLFAAIIRDACEQISRTLSAMEVDRLPIAESLERLGRRFLQLLLAREPMALYRVVVAEAPRFPEIGLIFYESGPRMMRERLAGHLATAAERGQLDIPDPVLAAEFFVGMLTGHFHLRPLLGLSGPPAPAEIEARVRASVAAFVKAFAA